MATLVELARRHTTLDPSGLGHLQRLVASWGMLSDLCFADLLLLAPVRDDKTFVVLGQMRPTTNRTLHEDDLVGHVLTPDDRPPAVRALELGEIVEGDVDVLARRERARVQCIPVRWKGEVIAVLTRESAPSVGQRPGELERVYVETFERFARMIVRGEFPFGGEDPATEDAPRVGDGVLLLDAGERVEFASPNAVSALHRMGVSSNVVGMRLGELGLDETAVRAAFGTVFPVAEEIERRPDVIVLLRCIPLVEESRVTGALVLMRDVTQLRRLDRLLLSKDAAIREVHHRVKNNLQTISSLLRLQARRLDSPECRDALEQAEGRIRPMARVHEILSREAVEQVPFNEIVDDLVRVAQDSALSLGLRVAFGITGDAGDLPAQVATPLAVVIQELLHNSVKHAFRGPSSDRSDREPRVDVVLDNDGVRLEVTVRDTGRGLPPEFSPDRAGSFGLSIARLLVTTQLGGSITFASDSGTRVSLNLPLDAALA